MYIFCFHIIELMQIMRIYSCKFITYCGWGGGKTKCICLIHEFDRPTKLLTYFFD